MHELGTLAFAYEPREDRILVAVNPGRTQSWACWFTRRFTLAALPQLHQFIESTSALARQAAPEFRAEIVAFERDAAIASTKQAMTPTPIDVLKTGMQSAKRAERLTVTCRDHNFLLALNVAEDDAAVGLITRADLQRILRMLEQQVEKAGWVNPPERFPARAGANPAEATWLVRH